MDTYDLVIKTGRIMDPASESEGAYNIGVRGGMIATLSLEDLGGARVIDASNRVVAPGFVDIHTHADGFAAGMATMLWATLWVLERASGPIAVAQAADWPLFGQEIETCQLIR